MLRLSLRPKPSSLVVRAAFIASLSHVPVRGPPTVPSIGGSRSFVTSLKGESTGHEPTGLDKFLHSVKLLNAAVGERDLVGVEPLLESMHELGSNANATEELLASVEAFSRLQAPAVKNPSVRLMLASSIGDFYLQKLQRPELAAASYLEALELVPNLPEEHADARDCLQVELLSNVVQCHKRIGRAADADEYFHQAISAHEQHRQRRGLSSTPDIDAVFHEKLEYRVLDLQLGFMEHLLAAKRWDEVSVLLERVVQQIEDSPDLSSADKLAEIQVVINKSVEWLAATDNPRPRISFGITRSPRCAEDVEELLARRRQVNKLWGLDLEDGVKLLKRENELLDEFAGKIKAIKDEKDALGLATSAYESLKTELPSGCSTCTMALMIASKYFTDAQYSSALTYYLKALELFASTPSDQMRRAWHMPWVEREVMRVGALCAVASCYQKLGDLTRSNLYVVQARDAYDSVCRRVSSRDPATPFVDARALCPSTDDEERLLSGLALTVASTLVDYAENLASQKDCEKAKACTDRAIELAQGCAISLHHIKSRVDRILQDGEL